MTCATQSLCQTACSSRLSFSAQSPVVRRSQRAAAFVLRHLRSTTRPLITNGTSLRACDSRCLRHCEQVLRLDDFVLFFSARESPKVCAVQRMYLISLTLDCTSKDERVVEPPATDALVCTACNGCAVLAPRKRYWRENSSRMPYMCSVERSNQHGGVTKNSGGSHFRPAKRRRRSSRSFSTFVLFPVLGASVKSRNHQNGDCALNTSGTVFAMRSRVRAEIFFSIVLVSACAKTTAPASPGSASPPPVRAAATTIATVADASPIVSATTTAVSATPAVANTVRAVHSGPAPTAAPPSDADRQTFAMAVCAAEQMPAPSWMKPAKTLFGCNGSPPYTKPEQAPDGKVRPHAGSAETFCSLATVYRGSFSRANAKQAVLAFDACTDGKTEFWDMAFPGSALLVEEVAGVWKTVSVLSAINSQRCKQIPRPGSVDALLCQSTVGAFGIGSNTTTTLLDFTTTEPSATALISFFGQDFSCGTLPMRSGFTMASVKSSTLVDLNKDGTLDLVLDVERAYADPPEKFDRAAEALCKRAPMTTNVKALLPKPKTVRLELLSKGDAFLPAAATEKILKAWDAETPRTGLSPGEDSP
jgi:hypothetical protein